MTDERPSWDETWLSVADTVGQRSKCSRAQVGAVIVTMDNRPVATGYNGPPRGLAVSGTCDNWCPRARGETELGANYDECFTIHAETNALIRADFTQIQRGTIYVSHASCISCAKSIANSGIARLVHRVGPGDAHRDPERVERYLRQVGISVSRG